MKTNFSQVGFYFLLSSPTSSNLIGQLNFFYPIRKQKKIFCERPLKSSQLECLYNLYLMDDLVKKLAQL